MVWNPKTGSKVEANYRGIRMVFLSVDRFEILVPTGNELALSILPQERVASK